MDLSVSDVNPVAGLQSFRPLAYLTFWGSRTAAILQ